MDNPAHKAELNLIAGSLEAINHWLFSMAKDNKETYAKSIFDYVKKALSKRDDLTRFSVPRGKFNQMHNTISGFRIDVFKCSLCFDGIGCQLRSTCSPSTRASSTSSSTTTRRFTSPPPAETTRTSFITFRRGPSTRTTKSSAWLTSLSTPSINK